MHPVQRCELRTDALPEIHDARGQIRGAKPQKDYSTGCQVRRSLVHGNGPGFQHYQAAVQLVQQGKYEKALAAFEKLLPARRPRSWNAAGCTSAPASGSWSSTGLAFLTPEEHYDYAVSQLNSGYYEEAREQFNGILADDPAGRLRLLRAGGARRDHRTYAGCLDNLARAIELNPKNRLQARSTTISRTWWTIRASPSCCILRFRRRVHRLCRMLCSGSSANLLRTISCRELVLTEHP